MLNILCKNNLDINIEAYDNVRSEYLYLKLKHLLKFQAEWTPMIKFMENITFLQENLS